jgi:hypothetical protein
MRIDRICRVLTYAILVFVYGVLAVAGYAIVASVAGAAPAPAVSPVYTPTELAFTGSSPGWLLSVGFALLGVGVGLILNPFKDRK